MTKEEYTRKYKEIDKMDYVYIPFHPGDILMPNDDFISTYGPDYGILVTVGCKLEVIASDIYPYPHMDVYIIDHPKKELIGVSRTDIRCLRRFFQLFHVSSPFSEQINSIYQNCLRR